MNWLHKWFQQILDAINRLQKTQDASNDYLNVVIASQQKLEDKVNNLSTAVVAILSQQLVLAKTLDQILALIKVLEEPEQPTSFTAEITTNNPNEKGDIMAKQKVGTVLQFLDDGTGTLTVNILDQAGLVIQPYPSAITDVTATTSDATPGPSAFTIGAFNPTAGTFPVTVNTPPSPLPAGWGQNVDFTVTVNSGLVGQTQPVTEDAGTVDLEADSSKPSGFNAVVTQP